MPKLRGKNARVTSTLRQSVPVSEQYDLAEYDGIPRSLFVLDGNTNRLLIGTTTDFPAVLAKLFRDNGMTEGSYYVSTPSKSAVYALRELRAFCVENSDEHLELNLFRGIDFSTVADRATKLIPGEVSLKP